MGLRVEIEEIFDRSSVVLTGDGVGETGGIGVTGGVIWIGSVDTDQ